MIWRWLGAAILGAALLWLGPPLLAVAVHASGLRHDDPNADQLFRAAPAAAALGIVRVTGNTYLLRGRLGFPSVFTTGAQGWRTTWHEGNGYTFARQNERLSGTCGRFSGGFDVYRMRHWTVKP